MDTTPADGVKTVKDLPLLEKTEEKSLIARHRKLQGIRRHLEKSKQIARPYHHHHHKVSQKTKPKQQRHESIISSDPLKSPSIEKAQVNEKVLQLKRTQVNPTKEKNVKAKKKGNKLVPLGFIIIPKDSEPKLASTVKITWIQCCCLRGWSSILFFESCLTYLCFPMNLTLGLVTLIWSWNEKEEVRTIFLDYSPMSVCVLTEVIGGSCIFIALLLIVGTVLRRGVFIIFSTFVVLLNMVLLGLLCSFLVIHASDLEIQEYLRELIDSYMMVGQDRMTKITDHINSNFDCCGIHDPKSWENQTELSIDRDDAHALPPSCCANLKLHDSQSNGSSSNKCYRTMDTQDMMYWFYNKEGCLKKLQQYFQRHNKIVLVFACALLIILFFTLIFSIIYMIRLYATLSQHVHPKIRTLIDEVVENAEDEIFSNGSNNYDSFDDNVKDYIRYNLNKCHTLDEVQQFLSTTADVCAYVRNLKPGAFVRDILSQNEELLLKFEAILENLTAKLVATDKKDVKTQWRLKRARKNWKRMKNKIIKLRKTRPQ